MGYDSHMSGEITIEPPLNWTEYQAAGRFRRTADGGDGRDTWLHLPLQEQPVETDDGTLVRKFADRIEPRTDEPVRRAEQGMSDDLAVLVDMFPGHTFTGHLYRAGVRQGDVQRYWVGDDQAVCTEHARLAWVDGTIVTEVS